MKRTAYGSISPARIAYRVSSSRSRSPSFCSRLARCRSTVLTLMTSSSAISFDEWPSATSLRISSSRSVIARAGHVAAVPDPVQVVADEGGDRARVEERLVAHGRAARLDQVPVGDRLQHVAGGAAFSASKKYCSLSYMVSIRMRSSGMHPGQLARGLEARQPGHRDVEDGQVGPLRAGHLDGLGAVARLGDDLEVRLAVEDQPHAAADEGVVVGEQDAGLAGPGGGVGHGQALPFRTGTSRRTSVPPSAPVPRVSVGADEQGAFAHAADARALRGVPEAAAVVADAQLHPAGAAAQGEFEQGGPGVPDGVRDGLLGDAVDDELGLLAERRQILLRSAA